MSVSYRILICDDDKCVTEYIRTSLLKLHPEIKNIKTNSNPEEIANTNCDILFMDIELNEYNGIDLAEQMLQKNPAVKIIFISGYHKYAQDIFRVSPVYYLQKPIQENMLDTAYMKAINELGSKQEATFTFNKNGSLYTLPCSEIIYFESSKRCCTIHYAKDNSLDCIEMSEFYSKLNDLDDTLPDYFIRCHQSYLVNMNYISSIEKKHLNLVTKETLPISQSRVQELRMEYVRFLGKKI
ncbi:MAG: LytTR family DNA-binding domain-containing protein [Clostridia bacterium]|nr:LytTR family DNA-binding domain-containing protein [Clostridia bacterium]